MRESYRIAFACALGAFIGTLFGLQLSSWSNLNSASSAFAGMIVGSIAGWVAIDFRELCSGVARAYRETIGWRPYDLRWKAFGLNAWGVFVMYGSIALYVGLGVGIFACFNGIAIAKVLDEEVAYAIVMLHILPPFSLLIGAMFSSRVGKKDTRRLNIREYIHSRDMARMHISVNPISIPVRVAKCLVWLIKRAPAAFSSGVEMFWQFATTTFVYVHSTRRTICGVDAGLGALVGLLCGDAFIGAAAGAVLGFVNYELVSVRLLKINVRR